MTERQSSDVIALLRGAALKDRDIEAVLTIDALMQNWRRRVSKREMGHQALENLHIDLDLAQLDVLVAIDGPNNEFGEQTGETMVATVAERLSIDPSRASRLVAEMVELGYAVRVASQADARRTLIALTDAGHAVVDAVRAYKFLVMGDFLADWTDEEVATFVPLLRRFSTWSEGVAERQHKFDGELEALAQRIAANQPASRKQHA
jgi:DNA-binding MarR family transcriptional regulator